MELVRRVVVDGLAGAFVGLVVLAILVLMKHLQP
jgi:hypothetical protein